MRRVDPDNPSSIRSLTHLAGNLNNKPAARNDHTAQPGAESTLNRFALKPLALRPSAAYRYEHYDQAPAARGHLDRNVDQQPRGASDQIRSRAPVRQLGQVREVGQLPGDDPHSLGRIRPGIDPIPVALPAGHG